MMGIGLARSGEHVFQCLDGQVPKIIIDTLECQDIRINGNQRADNGVDLFIPTTPEVTQQDTGAFAL